MTKTPRAPVTVRWLIDPDESVRVAAVLPVEVEVEKRLGISGKKQIEDEVGIAEFTRLCKESVLGYVDDWRTLTQRIGYWTDLDAAYWTFAPEYVESVWWQLKQIFDCPLGWLKAAASDGLLYSV